MVDRAPMSIVSRGGHGRGITLARALLLGLGAASISTAIALTFFFRDAHGRIDAAGHRAREAAARRLEARVKRELSRAPRALEHLDNGLRSGSVAEADPTAVEAVLFNALLDDAGLEEVTFTHAAQLEGDLAFDAQGEARLAPEGRWQVSVQRAIGGELVTTLTKQEGAVFVRFSRTRPRDGAFDAAPLEAGGPGVDPTLHATFSVLAAKRNQLRTIWSDLHFAELDGALQPSKQRIVVSTQRAIHDASGKFLGVGRAALDPRELDEIASERGEDAAMGDESRAVILAASPGPPTRAFLVARANPDDPFIITDKGDVRFPSDRAAPEIVALLKSPLVANLNPDAPSGDGELDVDGARWAAAMRELVVGPPGSGTDGWFVAVLAPKSFYTHELDAFVRLFVSAFAATAAILALVGAATLGAVRRGLSRVVASTTRMRAFDFAPTRGAPSAFREVNDVIDGLERAKTVVRAMGKYIPLDLVRRLYESNRDPQLGGDLVDVTLLFTDIEGFTTLAEKLAPDELARRLGDYLDAMTRAVESTGGTIDKYIGDAVMAFWNAPTPVRDHAEAACRAVLACRARTAALYESPAWEGLPPLVTRYGVHTANVMVGHFGAPTRLAYTALGDGVNLAARLEPLCKQYGVVALVSEIVAAAARDSFVFRRVDRVAVKGKRHGVDVFELVCAKGDAAANAPHVAAYERAFEAYLSRDFDAAIATLTPQADDGPSAVLLARCRDLAVDPPPASWDGVHVAKTK